MAVLADARDGGKIMSESLYLPCRDVTAVARLTRRRPFAPLLARYEQVFRAAEPGILAVRVHKRRDLPVDARRWRPPALCACRGAPGPTSEAITKFGKSAGTNMGTKTLAGDGTHRAWGGVKLSTT